jgi:hypothetical protein
MLLKILYDFNTIYTLLADHASENLPCSAVKEWVKLGYQTGAGRTLPLEASASGMEKGKDRANITGLYFGVNILV